MMSPGLTFPTVFISVNPFPCSMASWYLAAVGRRLSNHFLKVAPAEAERLPAEARALLGYESYGEVARLGLVDFDPVGRRAPAQA